MSAAYIQVHFRLDFFMEVNNMNPDQTALGSSLIWVHIACNIGYLTHLSGMELPTVINWNSPFLFQGMLGGIFHFYSKINRTFCKQTVETLIRRGILWRLVWVCIVCLRPTKWMLGLYGLRI